MERRKSQSLTDALSYFMRDSGLETPLLHHRLVANWATTVKPDIARRTRAVRVQNQCLVVAAESKCGWHHHPRYPFLFEDMTPMSDTLHPFCCILHFLQLSDFQT